MAKNTTTTHRRLVKLQKRLHNSIKAEVRKAIGTQSKSIRKYYEAYKREFRTNYRSSNKEDLLKSCVESDVILVGDYHTFSQSQRTALRLLRELVNWDKPVAIALEMIESRHQKVLDSYLKGKLSDKVFLEQIDYEESWGFSWKNFKPILQFAIDHGLRVIALNVMDSDLKVRDEHAANVIGRYLSRHSKDRVFVLYGDLHLARSHIPKALKKELREFNLKKKILTIFQNSETIYWKLAQARLQHVVDVVRLGRDRYCVMNSAPWIKLQSYLQWAEASEELEPETEIDSGILLEQAHSRLSDIASTLGAKISKDVNFNIETISDLSFLDGIELTIEQHKTLKSYVTCSRNIYIKKTKTVYLASTGINSICEGTTLCLTSILSGKDPLQFHIPDQHFYSALLCQMFSYFGSKIFNHKRKCSLEEDFRNEYERPLGKNPLAEERLQKKVAQVVLSHCRAKRSFLKTGRYIGHRNEAKSSRSRTAVFIESTRALGCIMGEYLYTAFETGRIDSSEITKMMKYGIKSEKTAKATYLNLIKALAQVQLSHQTKSALL